MKEILKKRVHFYVPEYLHTIVKKEAAERKITITQFFIDAMLAHLVKGNDENKRMPTVQK